MHGPRPPRVADHIAEIEFQNQRSRGPGGQHVNKTNSSVQLRWDYQLSPYLSEEQKLIIGAKMQNIINVEGIIYIRSDKHRSQDDNRREVLKKLEELLTKAFFKPKPRKATKPTRSSKERRIQTKKHNSETKKSRQTKWG